MSRAPSADCCLGMAQCMGPGHLQPFSSSLTVTSRVFGCFLVDLLHLVPGAAGRVLPDMNPQAALPQPHLIFKLQHHPMNDQGML